MSGQASRSHALRFVRWREQVARLLPRIRVTDYAYPGELFIAGDSFDAHAAREWAEAELRACDEADQHRAVLEDWTRDRGLGPENREPGAFVIGKRWVCRVCQTPAPKDGAECKSCGNSDEQGNDWTETFLSGGWPGRLMRDPACPVPRWTPNAAGRRRVAQRLLDTLDGSCPWAPSAPRQPSECQRCAGAGGYPTQEPAQWLTTMGPGRGVFGIHQSEASARAQANASRGLHVKRDDYRCPDCRGTGHNLRGYLPEVEWSQSVVVAVADSLRSGAPPQRRQDEWTMRLYNRHPDLRRRVDELPTVDEPPVVGRNRTRVTARGTHRDKTLLGGGGLYPHARYTDQQARSLLPRWRRGELRHAEQRRERALRRRLGIVRMGHGSPPSIEASMRAAAPSVDRVEVGRASEAEPYVVEISFHANTAEDARAAMLAAEEQRSAGMIYRYEATIAAASESIEMSIDFEIR